jgi:hypothetical protein
VDVEDVQPHPLLTVFSSMGVVDLSGGSETFTRFTRSAATP